MKAAAPHVKTICDGLGSYFEQALAGARRPTEGSRREAQDAAGPALRDDERQAALCVSNSLVDRMVYASSFGRLATLEENHQDAGAAVGGFCAAHAKLSSAAEAGTLSDDETYKAIVDAVKEGRSSSASSSDAGGDDAPGGEPSK